MVGLGLKKKRRGMPVQEPVQGWSAAAQGCGGVARTQQVHPAVV